MAVTRRGLLTKGTAAVGLLAATGSAFAKEGVGAEAGKGDSSKRAPAMIGACGLACKACALMKAGKCKGCGSGKEANDGVVKMKPCPVLTCAAMKKIDYCGTGCMMFTKCKKVVGKPYAPSFLAMIEKRLKPKG